MPTFDPSAYAPPIAVLLRHAPLNPLDPGTPDAARRPALAALNDDAFLPRRVVDRDMAAACRAGLWLLHDFLDESHALSQEIPTATGSYWHALMHRREKDFSNSKYWFHRVGDHPVFEALGLAARELAGEAPPTPARFLKTMAAWDPYAFVDLCEASLTGRSPCEALCRRIQQAEWRLLFDLCYRRAVGLDG